MLEVKNLSFSYKAHGPLVLNDLSFKAEDGRLIALLGPNGAGKTTLFLCLLGLVKKYTGEILIDGKDIRKMSRREMAQAAAYIPQSEVPVFNHTVFDTVLMGTTGELNFYSAPKKEQIDTAMEAIRFLGIEKLKDCGINEISGGERQLVMLARAMAQKAKIFIMDEPTSNLDYGNQQKVLDNIKMMVKKGYIIIISTHNPEHALQYATHVLAIKNNRIIADGEAKECLTEKLIEEIYGLKVNIIETIVDGTAVRSCIPATAARKE